MRTILIARFFAFSLSACTLMPFGLCQGPARILPYDGSGTMQAVAKLLEEGHVSRHAVDDTVSNHAFDAMFHALDPQRLIFLQSDLDQLGSERNQLDNYLRAGDLNFALRVQKLFDQRLREASERALQWLAIEPNFSVDESLSTDFKASGFASSTDSLNDRWRRRVKLDRLRLDYDKVPVDKAKQRLTSRYRRMAISESSPVLATSQFLAAIVSGYDPHTTYFAPRAAEEFAIRTRLNYEGIGAVLSDENGRAIIKSLMDGSARFSKEVQAGDVILAVGKDDGSAMEPVEGWPLGDIVDRIRGPRGTFVRLQLAADGKPPRIVTLERLKTQLADEFATGNIFDEGSERIGWIDLPGFYADPEGGHSSTSDVARLLADFRRRGVTSVVLDLRANGGGLLSESVSLTGLFLASGNVVRVEDSEGQINRHDDRDRRLAWQGPLLVLTSRLSASASEILAGAIQDHGRGLVIGDTTTHGKGTVQAVIDVANYPLRRGDRPSGALKLTIQQFYRPGGDSTQLRGVHADVVVPAWTESVTKGESADDTALPFRSIRPLVKGETVARNAALVIQLAHASAARVEKSPEFATVLRANEARLKQQGRYEIPLKRSTYAAYRTATKIALIDDDVAAEPEHYRVEVCRIARDYTQAMRAGQLGSADLPAG
ncbi:MAG: carboxyl-terminal processing protease [Planctomycetota bacterium]|jgi:carboxyl-terminal processing protease